MTKGRNKVQRRAMSRMEQKETELADLRIVEDPITIGPDQTINIDHLKLVAPSNVYDADFAWIKHRPGSLSLFFGKQSIDKEKELRTRLELRYPPENLVYHFWRNTREFHGRLQKFIDKWPKDEQRDSQDPSVWIADKDHSEWVNFEAIAHSGTEAMIDFYLLPPFGLAYFSQGRGSAGLKILPVVRVQLTTLELVRLLDSAADVVTAIEKYLPKKEGKPLQPEKTL